jgi:acyl-coenzyme A thioesterase PaaI-like protein
MSDKVKLTDNNGCFVCGKDNPVGLKLQFAVEGDEYVTYYTPPEEHQGWRGITHGGIIATVLDEVMARYAHVLGYNAITGEMTVRLKKPALTGHRLKFVGKLANRERRKLYMTGKAFDEDGTLIAAGSEIMIILDDSKSALIDASG